METIRVNMTPCEDIKTIHASQNDNEAREWGFELHNNGEKIDSSSISDQLVFKAYEGGTEEILPTNGSTPTTSPFLGDIRYPQGLLTDQEFLHRQSPTEEDGLAKITDIKGNTLTWNQQLNDTGSTTTTNGITFTKNADGSITLNGTATAQADYTFARFDYINGHKYLINGIPSGATVNGYRAFLFSTNETSNRIITTTRDDWFTPRIRVSSGVTVSNVVFRLNIFDLTKMGLDSITSVGEFTFLFPSYYAYNQGTLLSFMGNGIKTVGKNLVFKTIPNSSINASGAIISTSNFQMSVARVIKGKEYVITTNDNSKKVLGFYYEEPSVGSVSYNGERVDDSSSYTFTSPITGYVAFRSLDGYSTPMLEFGTSATSYEPYTSSTLSLPISTYFPNGMKSAGSVYDELTETKAITRTSYNTITRSDITSASVEATNTFRIGLGKQAVEPNNAYKIGLSNKYTLASSYAEIIANDKTIGFNATGTTMILHDSSLSTVNDLYTMFSSFTLEFVYPFVAPIETSFTTASLATENGEIPLSNEDGVLIGKCTEELSAEPGFHDAKIKLSDSDGDVYSNKIQLHIERSPQ